MRVLMIGAPGAGKGTQGVRVAEHYGIAHIASGDLLRQHIRDETTIGRVAKSYVSTGDLVPDAVVLDMLYKPVSAAAAAGGYVLDGFPRTVEQAENAYRVASQQGAHVRAAVYLDVEREELVRRLLSRGRGADDTPEVVEHRLAVYEAKTKPMLDYYSRRESVITIDGNQPPDAVTVALLKELERFRRDGSE